MAPTTVAPRGHVFLTAWGNLACLAMAIRDEVPDDSVAKNNPTGNRANEFEERVIVRTHVRLEGSGGREKRCRESKRYPRDLRHACPGDT